jgi:ankyrin repeat protein
MYDSADVLAFYLGVPCRSPLLQLRSAVVKMLLDKGANPNPNPHPSAESSPLLEAATAGDAASVEMLIGKGAEVKPVGEMAINMAVSMECPKCLSLLTAGSC